MKRLLDFIAKHESRGDYNRIVGLVKNKDYPPKPLTKMTVGEVLDWQDRIDPHYNSEAAGRYQIMEDTLRGLVRDGVVSLGDTFDAKTQDKLAATLLRRRGWDEWMTGEISTVKFANSVAMEWASLPVVSGPKSGRSYYDGDGQNSAGATRAEYLDVLAKIRPEINVHTYPDVPDFSFSGLFDIIAKILRRLFSGRRP